MNMRHWDNLKAVPRDALKPIEFGKLKGKSDINPQWRCESMTREFGPCGIGWKYQIVKTWTQELADGQLMLFVEVNLYIKDGETWSEPIPAIGGDFVIEKDKNGIHGNDEAYKMATTDALGVAMKMLGVAADVYRGLANDSKYGRVTEPSTNTSTPPQKPASVSPSASGGDVTDAQLRKLGMLAKENAMAPSDMKQLMQWKFHVDNSKKLSKAQASLLIGKMMELWEEFVATASKDEIAATTADSEPSSEKTCKECGFKTTDNIDTCPECYGELIEQSRD